MVVTAVMSSKGQVVIPAVLRRELGLKPGARLTFVKRGRGLLVKASDLDSDLEAVLALRGKYAGLPLEEELAESRRQDEAKLEAKYEDLCS
ncbi:MAG: AbrB/MazE/SpoVT family DNA-binding domain-containing protein [Terracidiphilus sp.]